MNNLNMSKNKTGFDPKWLFSYGLYIIFILLFIAFTFLTNNFFTAQNLSLVLADNSGFLVVAIGTTFVILTGHMNLSVGSIMLLSASVAYKLTRPLADDPAVYISLFILIAVAVGTICGIICGLLVAKLKVNHMLSTLGLMLLFKGVALTLTNALTLTIPNKISSVVLHRWFGYVPTNVFVAIIILILAQLLLSYTEFGRKIVAIGCNKKAAQIRGIRNDKMIFIAYLISGILAGLAGALTAFNSGGVGATLGSGMDFTAVAAIVLGGTSLSGGKGRIFPNTLLGVLLLGLLDNGLVMVGIDTFAIPVYKGAAIFIAMFADSLKNKIKS